MSGSRMLFDGRKQPRQSNFVQTCNLLSRYIKEKGSLKDLNIRIGGKVGSLQSIVKPGSTHPALMNDILTNKGNPLSMEQQQSLLMSNEDTKPSQLTIFYSGRVLVFDDYPADKVQDLVSFAKKESSQMSCGITSNVLSEKPSSTTTVSTSQDGLPPGPQPAHKAAAKEKTSEAEVSEANTSDLPIARRSSLHRFLKKRKDRAAARRPYHQVQEQAVCSSKGGEQLELKL